MGVALEQWRAAIGCFAQTGRRENNPGQSMENQAGYSNFLKLLHASKYCFTQLGFGKDSSDPRIKEQSEMCLRTMAGLVYVVLAFVILITCTISIISPLSFIGEYNIVYSTF